MSIPVNTNTPSTGSPGCSPVSSSCVVWQGPDIPCINLCKGDSIEKVVYDLATLLCTITEGVLDVTTLEFACLVEEGQTNPATLLETIQLLINKTCDIQANCCGEGSGGVTPPTPTPIPLPECLYFTEDGDQITQLLPDAYSQYLAEQICLVITSISSIQLAITNLNNRVTAIESALDGGAIGGGSQINVITQCASGASAGLTLPISQAFYNFETKFCQLQSLLGNNAAISAAIAKECTDLDTANQLSNPGDTMNELSGWVSSPTNLSQTIVNMWLTICDMRTKLVELTGGVAADCALVPPFNVTVTNKTINGCTVKWNLAPVGTLMAPLNYVVTITEWNGTTTVGSPVGSAIVAHPNTQHTFTNVGLPNKYYKIDVIADYTCGSTEPAVKIDTVRLSTAQYMVKVEDVVKSGSTITQVKCGGDDYPAVERLTTVTLVDVVTKLPVTNVGPNITVVLKYNYTGECPVTSQEDVSITILSGQTSGTYSYLGERYKKCSPLDPCLIEYKSYTCAVSISASNTVFAPSVTQCGAL